MVDGSIGLLGRVVRDRGRRLRRDVTLAARDLNVPFGKLLILLLDDVDAARRKVLADKHRLEDPAERTVALRRLTRLSNTLNVVHGLIATYKPDLDRRLPVGLMHLVHATVHDLIERPSSDGLFSGVFADLDPLVHLHHDNNYSVEDLYSELQTLFQEPVAGSVARPLVMNLPYLDPENAVLAPILAHEVAHIAADRWLEADLLPHLDQDRMDELFRTTVQPPINTSIEAARQVADQYVREWMLEELCDALACALSGPAFLYAEAAFLPAAKESRFGDHPTPQDRVRWALRFLDELQWTEWIEEHSPQCLNYLRAVATQPASLAPQIYETYVRAVVDENIGALVGTVKSVLSHTLEPAGFAEVDQQHELTESLVRGFMPPNIGTDPPTLWHFLLAGWAAWLQGRDTPEALAQAVSDEAYNRFLIKGLELVGISQLWRYDDTHPA